VRFNEGGMSVAAMPSRAAVSWERITYTKYQETTERLSVPGGWLYRTIAYGMDGIPSVAMTFVEEK
jgi:hypothetical protein